MAFRKRLDKLEGKARNEIKDIYSSVLKEMHPWVLAYHAKKAADIAAGVDPHDAGGVANAEQRRLIAQLEFELKAASAPLADITARAQADAFEIANSQAFKLAQVGAPDPLEVRVAWRRPSYEALKTLVGYAGDGRPLDTYFSSKLPAQGAKAVQEALYLSTVLNEAPKKAAKRLEGAVAGNAWRAETIARTEILRAHRETTRVNYEENNDVVLGYQWLAARDSRSCIICWMLSGKIFKTKDPFGTHVNCRCTLTPITDPADISEIPPGKAEFSKLTEDEQLDILGKPKWDAWKSGQLPLDNLIGFKKHPIFGPIRYERGLKDALSGPAPGSIPPQPKTLKKPAPKPKEPQAPPPTPVVQPAPAFTPPPPPPPKVVTPAAPPPVVPAPTQAPPAPAPKGLEKKKAQLEAREKAKLKPAQPVAPVAPSTPAPPKVPIAQPHAAPGGFPHETELPLLTPVRKLGGSTGAELVKDPRGNLWVRKSGASADHIRSEIAADNIYRALGANVPEAQLYETKGGPVKLASFIEGETLDKLSGKAKADAQAALREHFVADAFVGNWDVLGLNNDNILIDKKGKVWRIDNGGALKYRAQGGLKGKFDEHPLELWTMRVQDKNPRPLGANVSETFGPVTIQHISAQIRAIENLDQAKLKATFPADTRLALEGRLKELYRTRGHVKDLLSDQWKENYTDEVAYHALNLRAEGVIKAMPRKLAQTGSIPYIVYDEQGRAFDELRGAGKAMEAVANYFEKPGHNISLAPISYWQQSQAGNSWSHGVKGFKYFLATEARSASVKSYHWVGGEASAAQALQEAYIKVDKKTYFKSHAAYKALMLEFLQTVDFPLNDRVAKSVPLIRTENQVVMKKYKFDTSYAGASVQKKPLKRGASESFSIYTRVSVKGSHTTYQTVPHTRINGIYFFARKRGGNTTAFCGDGENEFACMFHDEEVTYKK